MTLEPQPQVQRQRRRFSSCHRHPAEPVTGICASCLRERLSRFDPAARHENSTATTAFKNFGRGGADGTNKGPSFPLELRRSKSLSGGKCEGSFERRRKSCDVRVRHSLWYLFNLDDQKNGMNGEVEVETGRVGLSGVADWVFESREENENEEEIRVSEGVLVPEANVTGERVEEVEEEVEAKTMKEHIDLEWQGMTHTGRDLKDIAGSFLMAASVFSKKLRKWQQRQKMKKIGRSCGGDGGGLGAMQVENSFGRQLRDTQSEIADYGYGRRSCDTDPRFSVDAGRLSLDDPPHSFDEARASWDGCWIGRPLPRFPPIVTVVENGTVPVRGLENHALIKEQINSINEVEKTLGRHSEQRQGRNFNRSSSHRKMPVGEVDEMKSASNAKVSPATVELFHGTKLLITDGDLRDSNSNSLQDDCSEGFEAATRDSASVVKRGKRKKFKKSRRWRKAWNIWGLMHRRSDSKCKDEERCYTGNVVEDPSVESWEKLGREYNGEAEGASDGTLMRSQSCVSSRNPCKMAGTFRSMSSSGENHEIKGYGNRRRELVLERNRIARHSPNDLDNGLLRFYLTPLRSYRKSKSGESRVKDSRSIVRSILRLH